MNNIMELMNAAERKHKSLRNKCGLIYDGDSVLMDIMDDADVEPDEFLEICKIGYPTNRVDVLRKEEPIDCV